MAEVEGRRDSWCGKGRGGGLDAEMTIPDRRIAEGLQKFKRDVQRALESLDNHFVVLFGCNFGDQHDKRFGAAE